MATKKISELTAVTTPLDGTEEIPVVQGAATKKVTIAELVLEVQQESSLGDLAGVTITTPVVDEVLTYDGTSWVNTALPPDPVLELDDLSDVVVSTPVTGEVLTYNGTSWANQTLPAYDLDDLTDVVITTATTNDILRFDGSSWVNSPQVNTLEELSDTDFTSSPTAGDMLVYDGSNWIPSPQSAQITVSSTAPSTPVVNQLWLDIS